MDLDILTPGQQNGQTFSLKVWPFLRPGHLPVRLQHADVLVLYTGEGLKEVMFP